MWLGVVLWLEGPSDVRDWEMGRERGSSGLEGFRELEQSQECMRVFRSATSAVLFNLG